MLKPILILLATAGAAHAQIRPYVYRLADYTVTDGDTIRTELDLGFSIYHVASARLDGIDAPERTTAAGKLVAKVVEQWMQSQQTLLVESVGRDKYAGRYAARIHGDFGTLADYLLERRLARLYDGGKRAPWTEAELARIERDAQAALEQGESTR